ncbi:MAG: hypothetical protein QM773_18985 [Hyphomonadaceae bacterium]
MVRTSSTSLSSSLAVIHLPGLSTMRVRIVGDEFIEMSSSVCRSSESHNISVSPSAAGAPESAPP